MILNKSSPWEWWCLWCSQLESKFLHIRGAKAKSKCRCPHVCLTLATCEQDYCLKRTWREPSSHKNKPHVEKSYGYDRHNTDCYTPKNITAGHDVCLCLCVRILFWVCFSSMLTKTTTVIIMKIIRVLHILSFVAVVKRCWCCLLHHIFTVFFLCRVVLFVLYLNLFADTRCVLWLKVRLRLSALSLLRKLKTLQELQRRW